MATPANSGPDRGESRDIANLLRVSVAVAATLLGVGLALFFLSGAPEAHSPAASIFTLLADAVRGTLSLKPASIIELGLIALLVTPILRIIAGVVASARRGDALYVLIGLAVLALVLYGLISGQSEG
jgi:uncharacterized membrane protein